MSPVVICVDFESYAAAMAAMKGIATTLPDLSPRMTAAIKDFERAHANCVRRDSGMPLPALLRRQAG